MGIQVVHQGENAEVSTTLEGSAESVDECVDDSVDTSTRARLVDALTDAVQRMLTEGDGEGARVSLRVLEDIARLVVTYQARLRRTKGRIQVWHQRREIEILLRSLSREALEEHQHAFEHSDSPRGQQPCILARVIGDRILADLADGDRRLRRHHRRHPRLSLRPSAPANPSGRPRMADGSDP